MILIPATRPDLVAWLCRFLTTLQLHWWIRICSCFVWLDTVFLWPVMISYKSSFGAECTVMILIPATRPDLVAWLCMILDHVEVALMNLFVLCLIGHCLAVASDDILQIIFRGWMSVMILIPATRPDLVAWLCRFLTTLQLHWWICSCFVWLDTVLLWPVMISYKSSFGAECLWWSLYQLLDLIWWPDSVDSWPRYSCTDEFVRVVSDWTLSCCGQWWYLTNHL